jgi:outer membrane protein
MVASGSRWRVFAQRSAVLAARSVILAAGAIASAPPARAQTLDAATFRALIESPKLKADHWRQDAARQDLKAARLSLLPIVMGNIDWTVSGSITSRPPSDPPIPPRPTRIDATLSQPILDGLRRVNEIGRAAAAATAGSFALADTEQQVRLDTVTAYLAVLRDRTIVTQRERSIASLASILKSTRVRFEGGETTKTDIAQAASRLEQGRAELDRAKGDLAASSTEFERLVGVKPGALSPSPLPAALLPRSADEAARLAADCNPKIGNADFTAVAADRAAAVAAGELAPTADLLVQRSIDYAYSASIDRLDTFAVKLRVRVPLFEPAAFPKAGAARAVARQRHYEAVDTRHGVVAAARTAFERYQAGTARANSLGKQIEYVRAALVGVTREAQGGQRTVLDVLNAEAETVNAEVALAIARYERDSAAYALLASVGRLIGPVQFAQRSEKTRSNDR